MLFRSESGLNAKVHHGGAHGAWQYVRSTGKSLGLHKTQNYDGIYDFFASTEAGDVFLGISTSGNSKNIIEACKVCKEKGLTSIVLLGKDGGKLKDLCDLPIIVPHVGYADRIQEVHTMIIHIMIRGIEELLK